MYIAIDVGGTKIQINYYQGLDPDSLVDSKKLNTSGDFDSDTNNILSQLKEYQDIKAVGVALPGFIVNKNKGVMSAANIADWENKDLKKLLTEKLNTNNIFLLHDGEAHAISETVWSTSSDSYLFIAWGTGIGATYIRKIGDEVFAQQIEFGFQLVKDQFIESLVGGNAFERRLEKQVDDFNKDDWNLIVEDFSTGIANMIALNYPNEIIWGGGVTFKQPDLIPLIMNRAHEKYPFWEMPKYKFAHFKENGGVIGALAEIKLKLKV